MAINKQKIILITVSILIYLFGFAIPAIAATTSISKGYSTNDDDLKPGMVAALSSDSSETKQTIERASINNRDKVVGIVTTLTESSVTLTNKEAKVHVADSGQAMAYVSDVEGEIKQGDFLEVSPLKGILVRSSGSDSANVVGIALKNQSEVNNETNTVQTESGSTKQVKIASIPIDIVQRSLSQDGNKRSFLILFGESITGKSVNEIQVIIAFIIFFTVLIVEGSIVYGAIQSSITAIGRNPLSKKAVYRQMFQVSILAIVILMVGLGAGYVVLWI